MLQSFLHILPNPHTELEAPKIREVPILGLCVVLSALMLSSGPCHADTNAAPVRSAQKPMILPPRMHSRPISGIYWIHLLRKAPLATASIQPKPERKPTSSMDSCTAGVTCLPVIVLIAPRTPLQQPWVSVQRAKRSRSGSRGAFYATLRRAFSEFWNRVRRPSRWH